MYWDGDWKFVWNGFDFDEFYNRALEPAHRDRLRQMTALARRIARQTGEQRFFTHYSYPTLVFAPFGPGIA